MPHVLAAAGTAGLPNIHIPNPFSYGADKVIGWIVSGVTKAINAFFGGLVTDALNPLLKLLGQTLLTTPDPSTLPRVGALWENSREIAVAAYALLILIAGILVMAYETVQTRHSIKEIAPRIVVGFLTANMSLLLAGKAVSFANAISTGVLSGGVDPKSAAVTLTSLVMNAVTNGGIFLVFIGLGLACILLALLVCYVIRVALTVILIAGAPLALMCHALPQTEGIARWWWRAFAGVLTIQLAQSLTLIAALNVFLSPGGFTFFGPTGGGLVDLIVTIALLYILYKIPFWILQSIQVGGGRSFIGSAVKGVIAYKTLGLLGLGAGAGMTSQRGLPGPGRPGAGPSGAGPSRGGPGRGGPPPGGQRRPVRPGGPRSAGGGPNATRSPAPRSTAGRAGIAASPRPGSAADHPSHGNDASDRSEGTSRHRTPAVTPLPRLATARPPDRPATAPGGLRTAAAATRPSARSGSVAAATPSTTPDPSRLATRRASAPRPAAARGDAAQTGSAGVAGFPPRVPVDLPSRARAQRATRPAGPPPPASGGAAGASPRPPAPLMATGPAARPAIRPVPIIPAPSSRRQVSDR